MGGLVVLEEGGVEFVYEGRGESVQGFGAVERYWGLLVGD